MIDLGKDAQGMGVAELSSLAAVIHITDEVLDSHLSDSISN